MKANVILALAFWVAAMQAPHAQEQVDLDQEAIADRVRVLTAQQMRSCWRMPTGEQFAERLVVTVQFNLREDGTIDGRPRVTRPQSYFFDPQMRRAVERALRAVRACAPYPFPDDPITADHYEIWREMELTFAPPPNPASR